MSVRIFPPSDEEHDDFEFHLDKFMGKWSVPFSVSISGIFPDFFWQVCHPFDIAALEGKCIVSPRGTAYLRLHRIKRTCR